MSAYWLIAVAAIMFGLYNVFIKVSAPHIHSVLGAVVLQFVAAFMGLAYLLFMRRNETAPLDVTAKGVGLAVLAGVAIGIVEIVTFMIYARGVPVAVANPLIVGGSLFVTGAVGVLLLRESLTPIQAAGILVIVVGVGLLAYGAARPATA